MVYWLDVTSGGGVALLFRILLTYTGKEEIITWLDFLKLRASWGQNGNCNVANFQYMAIQLGLDKIR